MRRGVAAGSVASAFLTGDAPAPSVVGVVAPLGSAELFAAFLVALSGAVAFFGPILASGTCFVSSAVRARTLGLSLAPRSSTPEVAEAPPASAELSTVTGSSSLSLTVVNTGTGPPAEGATVVANAPSGTFGSVTTIAPFVMRTRAPGVCATTRPSLNPFARPNGSTTTEVSDIAVTVTTRRASGAERGGSGAEFACTVVV